MKFKTLTAAAMLVVAPLTVPAPAAAATHSYDVVVYGATPGGVMAAIEARREGKTSVVVEPSSHVGGMVTGGLTHTDVGVTPSVISGITREYFSGIASVYGRGQGFDFEPKVGARVMQSMLTKAGVPVHTGEGGLAGRTSVAKSGSKLTSFTTIAGNTYTGTMFIDASYEGDLMANAGVSYTVGRESSAKYGETLAGVRPFSRDFNPSLSPYDENGKLYPHISTTPLGPVGSADDHVQAYNYRITSTDVASNRVPYPKPEGYDPAEFALLGKYLPLLQARLGRGLLASDVLLNVRLPNGKYDTNNRGAFSTDLMNGSFGYPEGSYAEREAIAERTKRYNQGLLYFLQNDPSVPSSLHNDMARFGLAADEFVDNGNWPTQLYVREARRMVGDFVLTQQDLQSTPTKPDTVAQGSYRLDQHSSHRGIAGNGNVQNEGTFTGSVSTASVYDLPYRILTPRRLEATNLLVPGTPSVSHVAWSGMRMEPQFMMLGQAAANAASMAIDKGIAVQDVSVPELQATLRSKGMVLGSTPAPSEVVVDNTATSGVSFSGTWSPSSTKTGFIGTNYVHDGNASTTKTVRWTPNLPSAGTYTVYARWTADTNRTTTAYYTVTDGAGTQTKVTRSQRVNGGTWVSLGTFSFKAGTTGSVLLSTAGASGYVVADAVRFAR